jgi:ribosome-associated translation inhibitor RaiA
VRANVVLFIGSDSNPNKYYCEIRLEVPGSDHFVKKSSDSFEAAIVDAVNTLQHAMRKAKEKQLDRNHGNLHSLFRTFFHAASVLTNATTDKKCCLIFSKKYCAS